MTRIQASGTALKDVGGGQRSAGPPTPQPARRGWVLGLTSAAYFMVVLDSLVVITALPRMRHDLHVGLAALQWTVNSYGIAFAAGVITAAHTGQAGWGSMGTVTALAVGTALLAAFFWWEGRAPEPMLPLRLLRIRAFAAGNATAFLMTGATFAAGFFVAQYFQFALATRRLPPAC